MEKDKNPKNRCGTTTFRIAKFDRGKRSPIFNRLLRRQILGQVGDGVALDGHAGGGPGEAGGGGGVDPGGVVHEIGGEGGILDLGVGHLPGELMDDGSHHLQVSQLFCTGIGDEMTPIACPWIAVVPNGIISQRRVAIKKKNRYNEQCTQ